ncbi:hypothetical protein EV361DRAFT_947737 [Lentinula raphanica]|uniref:Uncharacterized protein n=1 Tax=Lentinula raphanica TaxID=153919 RepID=A0AA38PKN3_9AGAR|nr:hypothetical protein F5878DRAFT_655674 [Lentinula raphanica]KAJ3973629.1 hypothetical protein EV361DRAFT_947737 [Lentinula raphanica]
MKVKNIDMSPLPNIVPSSDDNEIELSPFTLKRETIPSSEFVTPKRKRGRHSQSVILDLDMSNAGKQGTVVPMEESQTQDSQWDGFLAQADLVTDVSQTQDSPGLESVAPAIHESRIKVVPSCESPTSAIIGTAGAAQDIDPDMTLTALMDDTDMTYKPRRILIRRGSNTDIPSPLSQYRSGAAKLSNQLYNTELKCRELELKLSAACSDQLLAEIKLGTCNVEKEATIKENLKLRVENNDLRTELESLRKVVKEAGIKLLQFSI